MSGGMLNDMVGAAGCDGGGNAMMSGMNKLQGDMRQQMGMPMMDPSMQGVDELAMGPQEDWAADFHHQQMQMPPMCPMQGMQGGGGDWAAEMMQREQLHQAQQRPGGWVEEFDQQQSQPASWAEEFTTEGEVQTFGVAGEAEATYEAKMANCRSKEFSEVTRTGNQSWTEEYDAGVEAGLETDWASQYLNNADQDWAGKDEGAQEWMKQFKEMVGDSNLADEYLSSQREYKHDDDNPFMFHEDPFTEGMELKAAGCLAQAVLAFEATVRKDETHLEGWKQLGLTQADNEKEKHAVAALFRAKAIAPHDTDVLMQLGVSLTNEGHRDEATETFREWIASHPVHGEFAAKALAIVGMGDGVEEINNPSTDYFAKQDQEAARVIRVYEHVLQQAPDPELHGALGVLHHMAHQFDQAVEHYQALVKFPAKSEDSKLWNRLGAILSNGGRQEEALAAYNRALDINPGFVRAYYNIGVSHSQMGNNAEAAAAFVKALDIQGGGSGPSNQVNAGMYIWDSLRRAFAAMGRQDLYDLTWKGDLSLVSSFATEPPLQQS